MSSFVLRFGGELIGPYTFATEINEALLKGEEITIKIKHPKFAEQCLVSVEREENE